MSATPREPDADVSDHSETDAPLLYTPAEAAMLLKVPESWLRRRAGLRLIPCTFLGKHLRFSPRDLAAITDRGARPAAPGVEGRRGHTSRRT